MQYHDEASCPVCLFRNEFNSTICHFGFLREFGWPCERDWFTVSIFFRDAELRLSGPLRVNQQWDFIMHQLTRKVHLWAKKIKLPLGCRLIFAKNAARYENNNFSAKKNNKAAKNQEHKLKVKFFGVLRKLVSRRNELKNEKLSWFPKKLCLLHLEVFFNFIFKIISSDRICTEIATELYNLWIPVVYYVFLGTLVQLLGRLTEAKKNLVS